MGITTITVRRLDEKTKSKLRLQAASHGRSMEEEAREILRSALVEHGPEGGNLAKAIRRRFAHLGGVTIKPLRRDALRRPPDLGS